MANYHTAVSDAVQGATVPHRSFPFPDFEIRMDGDNDCNVSNTVLAIILKPTGEAEVTLTMNMRPLKFCSGSDNPVMVTAKFFLQDGTLADAVSMNSLKEGKNNYTYISQGQELSNPALVPQLASAELYFSGGHWSDP